MKISAETFKNIDYKQFALNHTEKFVVGLVGLFALYVLWKTAWVPISKTPGELAQMVTDTERRIETSEFPAEEKQKYGTADDLQRRAGALFSPIEVSRYQYNNNVFWPLYPRQEPIREPEWLPAENLIVDTGRVIVPMLRQPVGGKEVAKAEPAAKEPETDNDLENIFKRRIEDSGRGGGGRRTSRSTTSRRGGGFLGKGGTSFDNIDVEAIREAHERAQQAALQRTEKKKVSSTFGKGLQFVALRAIFPMRRQVQLIAKATNAANPKQVEHLVQFQDFEIERQTAQIGPNPWGGEWERIEVEGVRKLITEGIDGFDPEIVDIGVQSQVFTMPLPARVMGVWGKEVAHPDIENFTLSDAEIQRQVEINRELIDKFNAAVQKEEEKITRRSGWAQEQFDMMQIYERALKDQWTFKPGLLPDLAAMTPDEQAEVLKKEIQNRVQVAGQLLLFRYLDFAVEPGQVYRYRIRFRIYNPFFGSPPEWLADASVGEGEIRFTEWSEPSPPIQVETDSEYFLVDVNPGAGITSLPKASLDVFQWHPDAGTLVHEEMDLLAGEAISDEVKTEVLRPVEQTFAEEEIILDTRSMLVDAMAAPSVNPDLHPDLAFTPAQARSGLGITEQALIMDRFGRLKVIDSATQQRQHKNAQAMLRMQSSEYDSLREPEEVDEDELDRAARGMTKGAFGKAKGAKRTQNPNRKGR